MNGIVGQNRRPGAELPRAGNAAGGGIGPGAAAIAVIELRGIAVGQQAFVQIQRHPGRPALGKPHIDLHDAHVFRF